MGWSFKDLFNLEKQIGFYAQYHHNTVNFLIHVVGVPSILWTSLVFLTKYVQLPQFTPKCIYDIHALLGVPNMPITGGSIGFAVYSIGYMAMDLPAGILASALLAASSMTAWHFGETNPDAVKIAGIIHVGSWVAQFAGHFIFEGRAPALFDNLFQALYAAPFFVLLEIMFLFGYRKDLSKKIYDNAKADVAAWKASKKVK